MVPPPTTPNPTLTGRSVFTFTRTICWCDTEPKPKSKHLALLYHESEHPLRVTRANIIKSHQHRPTGFLCANIKKKKKNPQILKHFCVSCGIYIYIYILKGPIGFLVSIKGPESILEAFCSEWCFSHRPTVPITPRLWPRFYQHKRTNMNSTKLIYSYTCKSWTLLSLNDIKNFEAMIRFLIIKSYV